MAAVTWTPKTYYWDDPANWSTDSVPGPTDDVTISADAAFYYVWVGDGTTPCSDTVNSVSLVGNTYADLIVRDYSSLTINSLLRVAKGSLYTSTGATLTVGPGATFTNLSDGVLSNVSIEALTGSTITLPGGDIQTLTNAQIYLAGAGSTIRTGDGTHYTSVEQSLETISAGSTLSVAQRGYVTTNAIDNEGELLLTSGFSFSSGLLTSSGQLIMADGTIGSSIVSTGTCNVGGDITFSGASVDLAGGIVDPYYGGAGYVKFSGGTVAVPLGLNLQTRVIVAGAAVTLGADSRIVNFTLSSGSVTLEDDRLNLLKETEFDGGEILGAGTVRAVGDSSAQHLALGGSVKFANFGTFDLAGDLILGDGAGSAPAFDNRNVFDFTGDGGIGDGSSTHSVITNEATFEKTVGSGGSLKSVVAPEVVNAGTIQVSAGTLDFLNTVFGEGAMDVEAGAALEFGGFVAPNLQLNFAGAGAALVLDDAHDFHALIAGFGPGQSVDLVGFAVAGEKYRYTPDAGGANGYLLLSSAAGMANLHFQGDYQTSDFHIASDGHGGTLLTAPSI